MDGAMPRAVDKSRASRSLAKPALTTAGRESREVILDTARSLLEERGPAALSMREVARRTGTTHQAPYYHFGDRETVLAELVVQGFKTLRQRLKSSIDSEADRGLRDTLRAAGEAYIGFATANPGLFRTMFGSQLCDPMRFPEIREAGAAAYGELERLVRLVHGDDFSAELLGIYWAHVHGLACLIIDGPLATQFPNEAARDAYLRGIGTKFAELVTR
jgi:AcrR family transcriptional regulator